MAGCRYYILRSVITPIREYIGIRLRKKKHIHMSATRNSSEIRVVGRRGGVLAASTALLVTPSIYIYRDTHTWHANTYFIIITIIYNILLSYARRFYDRRTSEGWRRVSKVNFRRRDKHNEGLININYNR